MKRAFTLMELLLVMSLLSVTALLFITYTGDIGAVSVDALSRKIQSDIRLAQQMSTSSGQNHGVSFTADGNYVVYAGTVATPVTDPLENTPMIEDPSVFGQVKVANNYNVEFDSLGRPVIGGGGNIEVLADSGASRMIYVVNNTGAVVVAPPQYGSGCSCRMCSEGM